MFAQLALQRAAQKAVRPAIRKMGGDGHHGPTHVFDGEVFAKSTVLGWLTFIVGGGVGTILFAVTFQNKKHGFIK